jgi:autophagy-related protein 17
LYDYLYTLETLESRFGAYQHAYNRLLIEMDRRQHYQQAAERIVKTMMTELDALAVGQYLQYHRVIISRLTDVVEERGLRDLFKHEHGDHLPGDLCLSIENPPTRWAVLPVSWEQNSGDGQLKRGEVEVLPEIDLDLIVEARERISNVGDDLLVNGSTASLSYP